MRLPYSLWGREEPKSNKKGRINGLPDPLDALDYSLGGFHSGFWGICTRKS